MKKVPIGKSDGKKTFWVDEGWPENIKFNGATPAPVKSKSKKAAKAVDAYLKAQKAKTKSGDESPPEKKSKPEKKAKKVKRKK